MSIPITVAGVSYSVPSSAVDTDWAASQIAFEQALAAGLASGAAIQKLSSNVTPVGTGANTTEDTLMTYSLPAGILASSGQGIRVTACGLGVSTGDATTVRAYFGASAVLEMVLVASQGNGWRAVFELYRTGAATQVGSFQVGSGPVISGSAYQTFTNLVSGTETLSSAVTVKFTGQRASTSSANSIIQLSMLVELIP